MAGEDQAAPLGDLWIVARSVSFGDGVGGMERAVSDQARFLARLGWAVTVVAPHVSAHEVPRDVRVLQVPWPVSRVSPGRPAFGLVYALWVSRVKRQVQKKMPLGASLYLHGGAAGLLRGLKRLDTGRIVANPHGMEEFEPGGPLRWANRVFARHLARGARLADRVVATDQLLVEAVARNLLTESGQVIVIPNGVDVARLDKLAEAGATSDPASDIVSVGRLTPNKGYDMLLEAIRLVEQETGRRLTWTHFGRGPMLDELRAAADKHLPNARFVSGADDETVQAAIGKASIFVQPSRYEGSSLTTLEAMARQVVCVGTPVGGIPEKLVDGETGILAASATVQDLSVAIQRALGAGGSLGDNARKKVLDSYDLPVIAEQLSRAFQVAVDPAVSTVVQVARHIGAGAGVAQVVYSLEQAFKTHGVAVERVTLGTTGLRLRTQIGSGLVRKAALLVEVVWFSIAGSVVARRIMRSRPDAHVIVHGDPIGGHLYVNHGLLKEVLRRRRLGGAFPIPANPMHWFTLLRDEFRYRSAHQRAIVCLTEEDRGVLTALYDVKTPVRVIPNGVDLSHYGQPSVEERRERRESLGLGDADSVLLFVGHEYERKGLYLAMDALAHLEPTTVLAVVGGDPDMVASAAERANQVGVEDRVFLFGAQRDAKSFYRAADILVLPSAYETGPLVLLEALASGLMAVVASTGIAPSVIRSGVNGEIVERTPLMIAAGVRACQAKLRRDESTTREDCRQAAERYSWVSIASQYLEALGQVKK